MSHDEFKTRLENELSEVVAELKTIATQNPNTKDWVATPPTESIGNADTDLNSDIAEEWTVRRANLSQLEIRYQNIKRALNKMETGAFGICEISGEPIEEERLVANPAARTNLANIDREKELPL
jgi:RNA polymerase-binding transcription factor DksA